LKRCGTNSGLPRYGAIPARFWRESNKTVKLDARQKHSGMTTGWLRGKEVPAMLVYRPVTD
jgi:hypothetical protein